MVPGEVDKKPAAVSGTPETGKPEPFQPPAKPPKIEAESPNPRQGKDDKPVIIPPIIPRRISGTVAKSIKTEKKTIDKNVSVEKADRESPEKKVAISQKLFSSWQMPQQQQIKLEWQLGNCNICAEQKISFMNDMKQNKICSIFR